MRVKEIIVEMSNAVRKDTSDPNVNRYFNVGSGRLGHVLNQTGDNNFYPSSGRDQFDSLKELTDTIKNFENKVHSKIIWTNPEALNNARAFGVLKLVNEKNNIVYVGKLLKSNHTMIHNTKHGHDSNDSHPNKFDTSALTKLGYVYGRTSQYDTTKLRELSNIAIRTGDWSDYESYINNPNKVTAQSGQSQQVQSQGFEPVDVLNPLTNLTRTDIVFQIEKKYQNTIASLVEVTKLIASGKSGPYPLPNMSVNKFATQFCEILQPLAIASGGLSIEDYDTKNSLLSFNSSRSEKGWDSKLTMPDGQILNVSTKRDKGFPSTLSTFDKIIDEVSPAEAKYFKNEISILKTIIASPVTPRENNMGVLKLAADLKVISNSDAEYISKMYTPQNARDYRATEGKDFEIPKDAPPSVINYINKGKETSRHGLHPYYNSLYYVMTMLAQKLNSNNKMKELLKNLYNKSNSVLISTVTNGNSFIFVRKNADVNITAKPGYVPDWANKMLSFYVS